MTNITLFVVCIVRLEWICVDLSVSTHPDANTIFLPVKTVIKSLFGVDKIRGGEPIRLTALIAI